MTSLRFLRKRRQPRVAEGIRLYAVGDIHGRSDLLERTFARIDTDLRKNPISESAEIYLGDYIDRGPDSCQVLDRLVVRSKLRTTVFLKGNHESLIIDFMAKPTILRNWQHLGGLETLMSYGIQPSINANVETQAKLAAALDRALPLSHRSFLLNLDLTFTSGDFFFVHAGVRPGIPLAKQGEGDLLWIRNEFLSCEDDFGKIIVHGHTPVPELDVRPNRINIDTGAYATEKLTCLAFEGEKIRLI
jgi:diadenosine tetraphosphatase ApaH/serine/threonine PP2A family protein phosphatase